MSTSMSDRRAYSLISIKSVEEGDRLVKGIATTPKPDRVGDVVEPLGAVFKVPMPLLLDHDHRTQVGHVEFAQPTAAGIPFKARIATVTEAGEVKDLVDKAWHLVKYKLRSAVSIGFRGLEGGVDLLKTGGWHFKKWEWLELSLVTVPAQDDAVILNAKSMNDDVIRVCRTARLRVQRPVRIVRLSESERTWR